METLGFDVYVVISVTSGSFHSSDFESPLDNSDILTKNILLVTVN